MNKLSQSSPSSTRMPVPEGCSEAEETIDSKSSPHPLREVSFAPLPVRTFETLNTNSAPQPPLNGQDVSILWYTDDEFKSNTRHIRKTVAKMRKGIDIDATASDDMTSRGIEHLLSRDVLEAQISATDAVLRTVLDEQHRYTSHKKTTTTTTTTTTECAEIESDDVNEFDMLAMRLASLSAVESQSSRDAALLTAAQDEAYVLTSW